MCTVQSPSLSGLMLRGKRRNGWFPWNVCFLSGPAHEAVIYTDLFLQLETGEGVGESVCVWVCNKIKHYSILLSYGISWDVDLQWEQSRMLCQLSLKHVCVNTLIKQIVQVLESDWPSQIWSHCKWLYICVVVCRDLQGAVHPAKEEYKNKSYVSIPLFSSNLTLKWHSRTFLKVSGQRSHTFLRETWVTFSANHQRSTHLEAPPAKLHPIQSNACKMFVLINAVF